jgi:hypothetical protein
MAVASPSGLTALAGYTAISKPDAFASPEQRMGGVANPYHAHVGEQAIPYSWQSQVVPGAHPGPRGTENQMLGDPMWFIESAGSPEQDPLFDYNMPDLTRSHGSVKNVTLSGTLPSQADSVNLQTAQMDNKASDLGTSRKMSHDVRGLGVQNDNWQELWEVNNGSVDLPPITKQIAFQANGFGVNDATSNAYHKANPFGLDSKHQHRRYAWNNIPGNHMWMVPGGRPLFKSIAGVARPPIGAGSQFEGQDIGFAFSYDTGATLMATPQEYVPPPSPNVQTQTPTYDNPMGTDPIDMW